MGAPKIETFPIQLLGLTMITVDHSLQSRMTTSTDYQKEFSDAMKRGDKFPPVVVFFDGKSYWLADGFHRYGATRDLGKTDRNFLQIRAQVRPGTRRDAALFSAGANKIFTIPRTPEDKRRSVRMVLDDPEGRAWEPKRIMDHVGVTSSTFDAAVLDYFEEKGEPIPEHLQPKQPKQRPQPGIYLQHGVYYTFIKRRTYNLGKNRAVAEKKYVKICEDQFRVTLSPGSLDRFFIAGGLKMDRVSFRDPMGFTASVMVGHGCMVTWDDLNRPGNPLAMAVGQLLIGREVHDSPRGRMIVLSYLGEKSSPALEAARSLGVEFLTPAEFVASVRGDA